MKVALLLSGLPRMVKGGYDSTWSHVINNYDTDIYLHAWKDSTYGCEWEQVLETYNLPSVKSLQIQAPFKFTKYKEGIELPHTDTSRPLPEYDVMSCFRQFPMFYSWQKVYDNYLDSNIHYDCVIRSRYDLASNSSLNLEILDLNYLNHGSKANFFDDNLCITNSENAHKIFYKIFDKLLKHSKSIGTLNSAESSWTDLIAESGCESTVRPELDFQLLRENMLWWEN